LRLLICPREFIQFDPCQLAGGIKAGWTVFNSGAGANQAHEINVAALAMISPLIMHLNPDR